MPPINRVTESSQRTRIGRLCTKNTSAILVNCSTACRLINGNGFIGSISTGHHQRPIKLMYQQMMQWCVRQHDTQERILRRDSLGQFDATSFPHQHNWPTRRAKQFHFVGD